MATPLSNSQDVMKAVGVEGIADYTDPEPLIGAPGFAVRRPYPPTSKLGRAVTQRGTPAVFSVIQFIVRPPTTPQGVSRVSLHVFLKNPWAEKHIAPPSLRRDDFSDPECPTPESLYLLQRAPKPIELNFIEEFFYDATDGKFYAASGEVTAKELLDCVYDYHCRTLGWCFRIKWRSRETACTILRELVWRGQDRCMWLLQHGYDIVPKPDRKRSLIHEPLHEYKFSDFDRVTDEDKSSFFGFQSSKRSLFSNLAVLSLAFLLIYYVLPRFTILRVIYVNTALSTAALLFGFLLADQLVPLGLQGVVCLLSRFRVPVLFIGKKVKA